MPSKWKEKPIYDKGRGIYLVTSAIDPKFPKKAVAEAKNMVYNQQSNNLETMRGATQKGSTAFGGLCTGLFDYDDGTLLQAGAADGNFYEFSGGDWAPAATGARVSGNDTTATTRWASENFYGATTGKALGIYCNGVDLPVKYEPVTGWTNLEPGSQEVPTTNVHFPVVFQNRLVLFDIANSLAHFSKAGDAEEFRDAQGGFELEIFRGYDGPITGAVVFANNLFVFKRNSVYRMEPAADIKTNGFFEQVTTKVGCLSHWSIKECGPEGAIWLTWLSSTGQQMAYPSDVSSSFQTRTASRWIQPRFEDINDAYEATSFGVYHARREEYMLNYPSGSGQTPNLGLFANFAEGKVPRWTEFDAKQGLTAGLVQRVTNTAGVQYVADTAGKVWEMHIESSDTWGNSSFTSWVRTEFDVGGSPNRMKKYGYSFVTADVEGTVAPRVRQLLLRPSEKFPQHDTNSKTLDVTGDQGWGDGEWAVAKWGGTGIAGEEIKPTFARRGLGMQLLIDSSKWFRLRGYVNAHRVLSHRSAA